MTRYYAGAGGSNANAGTSYALRKLTLTGAEALALVSGDEIIAAPGVYPEGLTCTKSGGNQYVTGSVSVTNGSAVITGSGTAWLANAFANGQFRTTSLAIGADGVANGTTTFTSAAGNFQAGHVGMVIQVAGKAAYTITAVGSATSITLSGSPSAGSSLSYFMMTPEPIEILSVDNDTQITLKQPWVFPSFTGLAYEVYQDIKFIADVTGGLTDGIGGTVRVTGSDNDQTVTRNFCIDVVSTKFRTFRGFTLEMANSQCFNCSTGAAQDIIVEDCTLQESVGNAVGASGGATHLRFCIRRCRFWRTKGAAISLAAPSTVSNANHLIENCLFPASRTITLQSDRVGGIQVRNCSLTSGSGIFVATALAVGQTIVVNNCLFDALSTVFSVTTANEIMEDFNALFNCVTARSGGLATGANSNLLPSFLQNPLLLNGSIFSYIPFAPSSYSPLASIAGFNPPYEDFYGSARASPSSWGAVQYQAGRRASDAGISAGRRVGAK